MRIERFQRSAGWIIFLGVAFVIIGFFSIIAPWIAGLAATVVLGILLVVAGVLRGAFAFHAHSWGAGILGFLLGLLAIFCGGFVLRHPVLNLTTLTLFLAAFLTVEGVIEIIYAFKFQPHRGWVWMLISGIAGVFLGVMIWRSWPFSGTWAIGTLFGIAFLFRGFTLLSFGIDARGLKPA